VARFTKCKNFIGKS